MTKVKIAVFLLFLPLISSSQAFCQHKLDLKDYRQNPAGENIQHYHISGNDVLEVPQNIHILSLPLSSLENQYRIDLAWSDSALLTTSSFAEKSDALAAINGGFFHVINGGSITYIESGDEMVSRRSWRGDSPAGEKSNLNGAFIILNSGKILIEKAKSSSKYLNSNKEKFVLVTGPLLIQDSARSQLLSNSFVKKRHPRTCIGITKDELLLITIDGRHKQALGMNLHELQDFLISLGCINAINLDGGGSTSMWIRNDPISGIVNCPSDNKKFDHQGERKVANALLLLKN